MEINRVFEQQKSNCQAIRNTTARQRIEKLQKLHAAILARREGLEKALLDDLRKPVHETGLTELFQVTTEIKHACKNLHRWMRPQPVRNPLTFLGARGEVRFEPKGSVLILSPWNFPFQLAMCPLVSAMAAGNCIIMKPSEHSPNTSRFMGELISATFQENEVAVFEGDQTVATALLELPFDHIFFTGSSAVGKIVMQAAAKHLASVTLELGGKSPVLIDSSFDLKEAARKILWGKLINAGQACVAPDYLLIPESRQSEFIVLAKEMIQAMYGDPATSADYCRIITAGHQARIRTLIRDAVQQGAKLETEAGMDVERYVAPALLSNVSPESRIMQEEIFGPVLPVLPYRSLEDALALIRSKERPLSLYIFSRDSHFIEKVLRETSSGNICINDVAVQFANVELPFGGVNSSGIGNSHGYHGFKAFSNERAVLHQPKRGAMTFFYPPYTKKMKKLIDWTIKYL